MPIKTQNDLPVKEILERENIFVMDENRASHQNIRQLEIAIVKYSDTGQCDFCSYFDSRGYSHVTQPSE